MQEALGDALVDSLHKPGDDLWIRVRTDAWVRAGEVAKTSRSAHPERPVAINCVMFWDIPYRFSAEQPGMVQLSLAQVIANGANPYAYVLGHARNQPDRKNFPAVRRMMQFHKANERWYDGMQSAAQVLLVANGQAEDAYG